MTDPTTTEPATECDYDCEERGRDCDHVPAAPAAPRTACICGGSISADCPVHGDQRVMAAGDLGSAMRDADSGTEVLVHLPDGSVSGIADAYLDGSCAGVPVFRIELPDPSAPASAPAALDGPGTGGGEFKSSAENLNEAAPSSSRPESPAPSPGTVLGEEFRREIRGAVVAGLAGLFTIEHHRRALEWIIDTVEEVVASLVRDAEQRERAAILRDLAEFEAEAKAVQIKDAIDNARIVGVQDAQLVIRQRGSR